MRDFGYLEPGTVAEASGMLAEHGETCRVLAGGTALLLALRQRMIAPSHLVSLRRVHSLRGITFADGVLRIGASMLHAEIARSRLVRDHAPMLADMAGRLANPQVRNQGTIGGNLCYADPATDPPSCLIALGAHVVLESAHGQRLVEADRFVTDYFTTVLAPDELVTEIRVPTSPERTGYHARFLRTAAEHRPLVNLAVSVHREADACRDIRVVVGAATAVPTRLRKAEALLNGRTISTRLIAEAAELSAAEIEPISDLRGDGPFRRDMVRVLARRTIENLFGLGDDLAPRAA